jgi:hypothetical protein
MEKDKKKKYEKPQVTKIKLDPECAVLGFCKTTGTLGPGLPNCFVATACDSQGS